MKYFPVHFSLIKSTYKHNNKYFMNKKTGEVVYQKDFEKNNANAEDAKQFMDEQGYNLNIISEVLDNLLNKRQ